MLRRSPTPLHPLAAVAVALLAAVVLLAPAAADAHSIDRALIRRVIARRIPAISRCYAADPARPGEPLGEGRATVRFEIAPTGRVTSAAFVVDPLRSARVRSCVLAHFLRLRFPRFDGAGEPGSVTILYPLWFPPDGPGAD